MAVIKFYKDETKVEQVYPDLNPNGNYPSITVGLANNIVSPTGTTDTAVWNFRHTFDTGSPSDGYAQLRNLKGSTTSSTIEESLTYNLITSGVSSVSIDVNVFNKTIKQSGTYNFIYTPTINYDSALIYSLNKTTFSKFVGQETGTYSFTYKATITTAKTSQQGNFTLNQNTFLSKVSQTTGSYVFNYGGSEFGWTLSSDPQTQINVADYGISLSGTWNSGDNISINYSGNEWYKGTNTVVLSSYGIATTGTEAIGDSISINYVSNDWQLNGQVVSLSAYGITGLNGSPIIEDNIQVIYVAQQIGAIVISNPVALYATGQNQINKDGNQVFAGYTINANGSIAAAAGSYVVFFEVPYNSTYTVYDSVANAVTRVGFSTTKPTTSSNVTVLSTTTTGYTQGVKTDGCPTLANTSTVKHYTPTGRGYLVIASTDIENLASHPTWTAYEDESYESFYDSTLPIPYTDVNGTVISEYGIANLSSTYYDEIDFQHSRWYKRTDRMEYSASNLALVQSYGVPYVYDSNYIYYGISTVTYVLDPNISGNYQISEWGTEQFIGTTMNLTPTIFYQDNLVDKLRRSVEVVSNKVTSVSSSSTDSQYPSAKCVYDLDKALRKILGLDVDTFSTTKTYAVGDYVVYQGKLWKCTTAVTSAGSWKSANWTESYLFKA